MLAAKTYFDIREWFDAIYMQIESQRNNQLVKKVRQQIEDTEKEIAKVDMRVVNNINRIDVILF